MYPHTDTDTDRNTTQVPTYRQRENIFTSIQVHVPTYRHRQTAI